MLRKLILSLALMAGLVPAFAAPPPPVPALPDSERRTSYSISGSTCACSVGFQIYQDSTDVDNWLEVWISGVRYLSTDPVFGWAITSATGTLGTIPRPITNAVLTFNAVQTGTVQIVSAQRPRRLSTFSENQGVAARDFNQVLNGLTAQLRDNWDKTNDITGRSIIAPPGETLKVLAAAASRASTVLGFDALGQVALYSPASAVTSAASVNFLQQGTGAIARTVQQVLQNVIYADEYGMVCDGTTDDGPALQKAADAAKTLGNARVILPISANKCVVSTKVYRNESAASGILTVPGLKLSGQGKDASILDCRIANDYCIGINSTWQAAFNALSSASVTTGGSLSTTTYYVQITVNDPKNGNVETLVTLPKSFAVTSPGRIAVTLPSADPGYTFNIYLDTATQPAHYATANSANAINLAGNQTVNLDSVGSSHVVPSAPSATWQNASITDLTITNTVSTAGASGISYFKAGYAELKHVMIKNMLGNGFVVPNYTGDIDGSFVVQIDDTKYDTIAGWCMNLAGLTLEQSFPTVINSVFNVCGTLPANLNTNFTMTAITNASVGVVTTSGNHTLIPNDQIFINNVAGMTLASGWYRVCPTATQAVTATTFGLCNLSGGPLNTTSLGSYTASSGTESLSWRPPTTTTGSGGLQWMGLIGTFKNLGFTQNNNVAFYAAEGGTSDNLSMENVDFENTAGKGAYIASLAGGSFKNGECLSTSGLGNTISCIQLGTGFAAGGVQNFTVDGIKVRNNVTSPSVTAFEQFQNTSIGYTLSDTVRVRNVTWQTFDAANQTRFNGFVFDPIPGQVQFSISAANTAKLIPIGIGSCLPLHLQSSGEWVCYHVPSAGITGAVTGGLSATTVYNCYAFNSAATAFPYSISFECNATATALNEGYSVKSGDATRTFIGTATTDGSGNFQASGLQTSWYSPKPGQILGTATNDSACAGCVGEFVSLVIGSPGSALTTATPANVTNRILQAGDWDVWGNVCYIPAATTNTTTYITGINTTSATLPGTSSPDKESFISYPNAGQVIASGNHICTPMLQTQFSLSTATNIFLIARADFTVSTQTAYGYLMARRRR